MRFVGLFIILICVLISSCSREIPIVNLGVEENYTIARMQALWLEPAIEADSYRWLDSEGRVVCSQRKFCFISNRTGNYRFILEVSDGSETAVETIDILVVEEEIAYSPYICEVLEYYPAPGQFINTMPQYAPGDSYADMLGKAADEICGENRGMVSLGSFGGYLTFRFDHTVVNVVGENDFMILGNAIYQTGASAKRKGGSCEPGIVMVSLDENGNGLPDDPWYELAGSEHHNPLTCKNLRITYNRPNPDRPIVGEGNVNDKYYIPWETSSGETGFVTKNNFHNQEYYPAWVKDNQLSFCGTCLPANGEDPSGLGTYYILYAFDWGYADNHPNNYESLNSFDISNAIDNNGIPVYLPGADFIRVYTGVLQSCGWVGETSTEISHARDLHL